MRAGNPGSSCPGMKAAEVSLKKRRHAGFCDEKKTVAS